MEYQHIHAYAIDTTHIYFKCPCCKKKTIHRHGSCRNLMNRLEHRSSHCPSLSDYYLVIDDDTIRGSIGTNFRILKRSQPILEKIRRKQIRKKEKLLMKEK